MVVPPAARTSPGRRVRASSSWTSGTPGSSRSSSLQVADLEGLHGDLRPPVVDPVRAQRADERLLEPEAQAAEVRRVLELRDDPDAAAELAAEPVAHVDDLLEGGDLVAPVVERVARAERGQPLLRAQRLELGEREVLREPLVGERDAVDDLRRPAVRELRVVRDVRGAADRRLVAHDELTVLGRDQVGLDVVGAHPRGEPVGAERVLRPVAGCAAMAVDRGRVGAVAAAVGERDTGRGEHQEQCGAEDEAGEPPEGGSHGRHPTPPGRSRGDQVVTAHLTVRVATRRTAARPGRTPRPGRHHTCTATNFNCGIDGVRGVPRPTVIGAASVALRLTPGTRE